MVKKWLALLSHIVFLAPISVILAFAIFLQMLVLVMSEHFNPLIYLFNSHYREVYSATFWQFLLFLVLSLYFVYMSILTINTMFRLMSEVFSNDNEKEDKTL
jgi:ABC-type Fe3+ transport system permease subunit